MLLVWISFEDQSVTAVILFAAAICMLATTWLLARSKRSPSGKGWLVYPLAGLLGGLATAPLALLLMAIKTGLHGHPTPDYTAAQIVTILISAPIWVVAGLVIGLGAGLWIKNR
jgi:hypothetical protein